MTAKKPGAVRGQPRKPNKRAKVIGVRVTDDEHATITSAAGDEGASPFLRRVGMEAATDETRAHIKSAATRRGVSVATAAGDALEVGVKALLSRPIRGGPDYVPALCAAAVMDYRSDPRRCGKPAVCLRDGAYYCEDHR
jgi:hypothetical protein